MRPEVHYLVWSSLVLFPLLEKGAVPMKGEIIPLKLDKANRFVNCHHRHHYDVQGHKWSIGYEIENELVGVGIIGRPLSRILDDGFSLEITRICVLPEHPNVCSILIGALCRSAKSMGYKRVFTYTLESESGSSLKGAGFEELATKLYARKWKRNGISRPLLRQRSIQTKLFSGEKIDHLLHNKIRWGRLL